MKKNSIVNHNSYEKLLKEFHPTKNGELKLSDFSYGSHKKVWWKCDVADDHEWKAVIKSRAITEYGCPCCNGKKTVQSNCLATNAPNVAKNWHPTKNIDLTPLDVTIKSNIKIWWKCDVAEDHEWEDTISHQTDDRGCPCCSGKKTVLSNSLSKTHPHLIKEWHPSKNKNITPFEVSRGSEKNIWWACEKKHTCSSRINNRVNGNGCPTCNKSKGEKAIKLALEKMLMNYESQKRFKDCKNKRTLPFDFYLPDYNLLIEYDGIQHYKTINNNFFGGEKELLKTQKRDKIKDEYAKNNNIHLLRIPYTEFDNIEKIISNYLT